MKKIKLVVYVAFTLVAVLALNIFWCPLTEKLLASASCFIITALALIKFDFGKSLMNILRGKILGG